MEKIISFVIPFRSKWSTNNWELVSKLLEGTLTQLFEQTSDNFSVHVVGHDKPGFLSKFHDKVHFHELPMDPPKIKDIAEFNRDRYRKVIYGCIKASPDNPTYIMPLDADDRISKNLVGFLNDSERKDAWVITSGHVVNLGLNRYYTTNRFDCLCGSSCILSKEVTNPPTTLENMHQCFWLHHWHSNFQSDITERGLSLGRIPFPAAAYSVGYSDNLSNVMRRSVYRKFRFNLRFWLFGKKVSNTLLEEFGSFTHE